MFDRILVPLDGSPLAEGILTQARRLLNGRTTELHLLRVVDIPLSLARIDTAKLRDEERAAARRYLDGLSERLTQEGLRVRTHVIEGLTAEVIARAASLVRAQLIAISTHGRSGLARWVMGSVAEKVVRSSPVPVLLMRSYKPAGEPTGAVETGFHRILVPVDGSSNSLAVVPAVEALAKEYKAEVTVVAVDPPPGLPPAVYAERGYLPPEVPPHAKQDAAAAAEELKSAGVSASVVADQGDPADRILHVAADTRADLIAMATHGRSGWSRWVLGSVTERVLRHSNIPMLIVRSHEAL